MTICEHCGILMSDREARYFPGRGYPVKWLDAIEKVCPDCETILISGTPQQISGALAKHTRKAMELLGIEEAPQHECNDCGILIPDHCPICTLCERWYDEQGLPLPLGTNDDQYAEADRQLSEEYESK